MDHVGVATMVLGTYSKQSALSLLHGYHDILNHISDMILLSETLTYSKTSVNCGQSSPGAAIGNKIYFAPYCIDDNHITIWDTSTHNYTRGVYTALTGRDKFSGAVAFETKVYFVPYCENDVAVLDTVTNDFSSIPTQLTMEDKFVEAVVVGTKIYFAPYNEHNIGVLDTLTDTFSTIGTGLTGPEKYSEIRSINTTIYLAPFLQPNIGVLDTATGTFTTTDTGCHIDCRFNGLTVLGNRLYV